MRLKGIAFVLDEKIFLFIVMSLDAEVQGAYTHKSRVGATTESKIPKMFPEVQYTIGIEAKG